MKRKRQNGRALVSGVLCLGLLAGEVPAKANTVDPWVYARVAFDHFYNLEYPEAIANLKKALKSDPDNLMFRNSLTNTYLFQELSRLNLLEGNLYSASNDFLRRKKSKPDPKQVKLVHDGIRQVKELCRQRLAADPRDVEALYALGVAYATEANYKFTVEKAYLDALRRAGKANELHKRVLKLDPEFHDAKLVPGLYLYVVGSLPASVKWLAFLFGYRGDRPKGVEMLHQAMLFGKYVSTDSAVLLTVIYNREKNYDYARQILGKLEEYFPRNALIALEFGRSYEREGNRRRALEVYHQVAERMEAGRMGYSRVPRERLYYQIGSMHQTMQEFDQALAAYASVSAREDSDGLLRAYSLLRRGEIYTAQNQPERARTEYERVAAMPYEEPRALAQKRLRSLGQ